MYFGKVKKRISYWNVSGGKFLLTDPIFYDVPMHEIDANLKLLEVKDIKSKFLMPKLYLTNNEKIEVKKYIKTNNLSNFVAIYATPSQAYKSWGNENFNKLISLFPDQKFVIVGSKKDEKNMNEIIGDNKNIISLYDFNFRKLSYLFSFAKAVVAVDGGPMHLAWISNKNVIALFGQNDVTLWKPLNNCKVISHFPESEQGIFRKKLNLNKKNKYMDRITVQEVSNKLKKFI